MRSEDAVALERNPGGLRIMRLIWTITGASGAIGTKVGFGLDDQAPPARTAAGTYRLTLDKACKRLVDLKVSFKRATGTAVLHADHISGDASTSRDIVFETKVAAGTPTDPASGDVLYITLVIDEQGQMK